MMPKPLTIEDFLEAAEYPGRVQSYLHNLHEFENEITRVHGPSSHSHVKRTKSGWWHITGERRDGLTGEDMYWEPLKKSDVGALVGAGPAVLPPEMTLAEFAKLVMPHLEQIPKYMEQLLEKLDHPPVYDAAASRRAAKREQDRVLERAREGRQRIKERYAGDR